MVGGVGGVHGVVPEQHPALGRKAGGGHGVIAVVHTGHFRLAQVVTAVAEMALDILRKVPRLDDEFVFPSRKPGQSIKARGRAAERVKKVSGIDDFRSHDLRRTCGTGITRLGFSRFVMDRVLGHVESGVGSRYDRHDYLQEKTAALAAWGAKLNEILTGEPMPENVVELQRTGR